MKKLQMVYAASLIDSLRMYDLHSITEEVTLKKYKEQLLYGKQKCMQLHISSEEEVFTKLRDLFGCANWSIEKDEEKLTATATQCMLCGIAKKMGVSSPCKLFCLDPMEGLVKGINENNKYNVKSTLWDGTKCVVEVHK